MSRYGAICDAINEGWFVEFLYDGLVRVVIPAHVGVLNGEHTLVGYQVDGESNHGNIPDWRHFHVRKIRNFRVLELPIEFFPPGYKPGAGRLRMTVCCEL